MGIYLGRFAVLTPQGFSTSSLVFGPVIVHPGKYYTPRFSKVKDIFVLTDPTNDAKVRERAFVCLFRVFRG